MIIYGVENLLVVIVW